MALSLLVGSLIILICVCFSRISGKIGIPFLLVFIVLGMIFGSDGLFKIPFGDFQLAEKICTVALIFIMFYGGFGTRWSEAKPVAAKSILLSTLGVTATAGITGVFCHLVLKMDWLEGMLIGSVISSTDAASVFSILRSKKLGLKDNTASLLEMESGSNDPCSYMLTAIMISAMNSDVSGAAQIFYLVFSQFIYGIVLGFIIALVAKFILERVKFTTEGFDTLFLLGIAVLSYALPSFVSGNGYLSAYIVGIILGNSDIKNKQSMVHFFDGLTGLMQVVIFFLLGLLSFPSSLPSAFPVALAITLFLTFIARPISVFAILTPMKCSLRQQLLVSWSGLRGAASIVFAIMATVSLKSLSCDIYHIIFCMVLISITCQGTLIPFMSRKLDMIDKNENVLKTFNDYTDELDIQFIKLSMSGDEHPWINRKINELAVPWDLLFVLIIRNGRRIIPNGKTTLRENDIVVVSAPVYQGTGSVQFTEEKIHSGSDWIGRKISEYAKETKVFVMLIKRGKGVVIPRGPTDIEEHDVLVIHVAEPTENVVANS